MTTTNWILISELHSAFFMLGEFCDWDLDDGDIAKLLESFHSSFAALRFCFPTKKSELKKMFADAQLATGSAILQLKKTSDEEFYVFLTALDSTYRTATALHPDVFRLPYRDFCRKTLAVHCTAVSEAARERYRQHMLVRYESIGIKKI